MGDYIFSDFLDLEIRERGIPRNPPRRTFVHYAYSNGEVFRCTSKVEAERISKLTEAVCENESEIEEWQISINQVKSIARNVFANTIYKNEIHCNKNRHLFDKAFDFVDKKVGIEHPDFFQELESLCGFLEGLKPDDFLVISN